MAKWMNGLISDETGIRRVRNYGFPQGQKFLGSLFRTLFAGVFDVNGAKYNGDNSSAPLNSVEREKTYTPKQGGRCC
jgi:hypothetical protein